MTITNHQFVEANALSAARFGLLALRSGAWHGAQIIPAAAIAEAITSSQALNPSYGQLWWLNTGATGGGHQQLFDGVLRAGPYFPDAPADLFAALGKDDQIIACIPSLDLVIVRQGAQPLGSGSEAISAEQNILLGKIARAFGYTGQRQPWDLRIAVSATEVQLQWTSWFGRRYGAQQSVDLGLTPWENLAVEPLSGDGLPLTVNHALDVPNNFFPVQIVE